MVEGTALAAAADDGGWVCWLFELGGAVAGAFAPLSEEGGSTWSIGAAVVWTAALEAATDPPATLVSLVCGSGDGGGGGDDGGTGCGAGDGAVGPGSGFVFAEELVTLAATPLDPGTGDSGVAGAGGGTAV